MASRKRARPWKEEVKDLFAMNRGERRAFAVLIALCLVGAAWVTWEQWIRPRTLADQQQLEVLWWDMQDTTREGLSVAATQELQLFKFDPNGLPSEQWMALGLSERQAASIHRFEARGGKFRSKRDLARMYVVDPDLYAQWEPYIQLPAERPRPPRAERAGRERWPQDSARRAYGGSPRPRWEDAPVEINGADSAALVAVRGVGPSFARGIIGYRERLGGFISLDQLSEVYILRDKPEAVEQLRGKLTVDASLVRRIPLNACTVEELGPHPYAGWKLARALIAYREHHGPFADVAAITNCVLVTDSIRDRLAPYLIAEGE